MKSSNNKNQKDNEQINEEHSLKNAMYTSIIFVGGGLVFFWGLLFIIFKTSG